MKKRFQLFLFSLFLFIHSYSQNNISTDSSLEKRYIVAFLQLENCLKQNKTFKEAVFTAENCFDETTQPYEAYNPQIMGYINIAKKLYNQQKLVGYKSIDSTNFTINSSIYKLLKDTTILKIDSIKIPLPPFTYNFADPLGDQNITNTFVTKLLATQQGNCRSLSYLYKILADEMGAKCWLALAPGHIYIKNYSEKIGWYNTELTSGSFPTDAWLMATTYISPEAVKSGLYMDTLSNQQAIALCVFDLAKQYEFQTHNYNDGFILNCCDLVLKYHPVNPMALLLKAETLKKIYMHETTMKYPKITGTLNEMKSAYVELAKLGYREMSDKMYTKWLKSMEDQKKNSIGK